jgi:hypothetical protein
VPSVAKIMTIGADEGPPDCGDLQVQANSVTTVNIGQGNRIGHAEVTVGDNCGPANGVEVTGDFTGDIEEFDLLGNTDPDGQAVVETTLADKGKVDLTFCVDMLDADPYAGPNACASN